MGRWVVVFLLFVATFIAWTVPTSHELRVSFLNIGQGDAIFIQGPTGIQMLVDAGPPDRSVLRELGGVMSFFDRSIDVVMGTHPDQDHIGGIPDVLKNYSVKTFLLPGIKNDTKAARATALAVKESDVDVIEARRGMRLVLGGGAYADILFPDRALPNIETNTGSIVMRVVYGDTSFLLNGDSPQVIEKYLVALDGDGLKSTVLKVGHHGSKTSSSPEFVEAVSPLFGVYSRGCNNKYGHPAKVVVTLFQRLNIQTFDTCTDGRITFSSNGTAVRIVKN